MWTLSVTMPRASLNVFISYFTDTVLVLALCERVIKEHPSTCCTWIIISCIMLLYFLIVPEVNALAALFWKDALVSFKPTLTAAAAAQEPALSTAGAAKPRPALLHFQEQFQLPQCSEATIWSFHCFPLQWVCHLIQWQIHPIHLFVTSFSACLLAAAFLSGSMFAMCSCTLPFSKNMQRLSKFLGVLETPHMNYSTCIHG